MALVARLGDKCIGSCKVHGPDIIGTIITASPNVSVNNRQVARLGDKVLANCGHIATIITAAPKTDSNNRLGTARLGDKVGASPYEGIIITASTNVNAG
jgi:uncharacterized Zn-binding protein involved in type VI secretion